MSKRLHRIQRLVWLKERRRDAAQATLAAAQAQAQAAAARAERAERRFHVEAEEAMTMGTESADAPASEAPVSDWVVQRQHVAALGMQAAGAQADRAQAASMAAERRNEVHHAERQLRQMEKWSEVESARVQREGDRREQGALDELAAQITERRR